MELMSYRNPKLRVYLGGHLVIVLHVSASRPQAFSEAYNEGTPLVTEIDFTMPGVENPSG